MNVIRFKRDTRFRIPLSDRMLYYSDPVVELWQGDIRDVVKELKPGSADMIMTSPPFYGQRVYKISDTIWDGDENCKHEWGGDIPHPMRKSGKHSNKSIVAEGTKIAEHSVRVDSNQGKFCLLCGAWKGTLGNEPDPDLYIKHVCDIFNLLKPVLKKTATIWVNIADSYAGSGGAGGDYNEGGLREGQPKWKPPKVSTQAKSLIGIPERFVLEMQRRNYIRRNTIIWHKRNCMPESVTDRFTEDFEYLYLFSLQGKYFFERQFEPYTAPLDRWGGDDLVDNGQSSWSEETGQPLYRNRNLRPNSLGRNMRVVWDIPTASGMSGHYASYPEKLCETPILAGCPLYICSKCGKPRTKVYRKTGNKITHGGYGSVTAIEQGVSPTSSLLTKQVAEIIEAGYSDCKCGAPFVPGVLLDPFCGTGTTLSVAKRLGRKSIGVELSEKYCKLAVKRIEGTQSPLGGI